MLPTSTYNFTSDLPSNEVSPESFICIIFVGMNRFDRITSMLIHLQSKKVVTSQELADRYDISLRTVYRDIRSLEEAGIPIIGEAGRGYSLVDGYKLPPVMFTREEAMAFVASSKLLRNVGDEELKNSYESALFKIKAILKGPDKTIVENLEKNVKVIENRFTPPNKSIPLEKLLTAIAHKFVVNFEYFANSSQEITLRTVEPIGVFQTGNNWRLIAFCQLRNDYRDFRLDRITNIELSSKPFTKIHPPFDDFVNKEAKDFELIKVVFTTCKHSYRYFGDQKYYYGFVKEIDLGERMELHFLTSNIWSISRWAMSFMDSIEVIEPQEMIGKMRYIAERFLESTVSYQPSAERLAYLESVKN